eukprot:7520197-Lingulodinium_polyedra.AAC.1
MSSEASDCQLHADKPPHSPDQEPSVTTHDSDDVEIGPYGRRRQGRGTKNMNNGKGQRWCPRCHTQTYH